MKLFTTLRSVAAAMPQADIGTDQVIPARLMRRPRTMPEGYAPYLFHDMRRTASGEQSPDFPLNTAVNKGAAIIAAGRNFGCGSSREAAVYALVDSGVRCVIAPSHGDIFSANSVNNGLLPARVDEVEMEALLDLLERGGVEVEVDLQECKIKVGNRQFDFQLDPVWRTKLLNGWDDIDMTRRFANDIATFVAADTAKRPWACLPGDDEVRPPSAN
jgi:3-isopropylmalate/(R)-2-methylmalate dehydratase small subunit